MRKFLIPKYKYKCGMVHIMSDITLDDAKIALVIDIINDVMSYRMYEPCYHISRRIYHEIDIPIYKVEAYFNRKRLKIKIFKAK